MMGRAETAALDGVIASKKKQKVQAMIGGLVASAAKCGYWYAIR